LKRTTVVRLNTMKYLIQPKQNKFGLWEELVVSKCHELNKRHVIPRKMGH
jgi:hypothetical protein